MATNRHSIGLLILRLGIGALMCTHGWGKLQILLSGEFGQFPDPIGLGATLSLFLVAFAEFFCAILVLVGLATRFAAIPVVIAMLIAAFVVHGGDPWTMEQGAMLFLSEQAETFASKEPALLYLFPFLALALTGPGRFSIDHLVQSRRAPRHTLPPMD